MSLCLPVEGAELQILNGASCLTGLVSGQPLPVQKLFFLLT